VSTIKGFALSSGKPVAGVSTLRAMAWNFPFTSLQIVPFLDARRGEVFSASFRWEGGALLRLSEDSVQAPEEALEAIDGEALLVGDGTQKYRELIQNKLGPRALLASPNHGCIRASTVAYLGYENYLKGEVLDLSSFIPIYLRKSEAEVKREKGLL